VETRSAASSGVSSPLRIQCMTAARLWSLDAVTAAPSTCHPPSFEVPCQKSGPRDAAPYVGNETILRIRNRSLVLKKSHSKAMQDIGYSEGHRTWHFQVGGAAPSGRSSRSLWFWCNNREIWSAQWNSCGLLRFPSVKPFSVVLVHKIDEAGQRSLG
jgi:hypothetical protein